MDPMGMQNAIFFLTHFITYQVAVASIPREPRREQFVFGEAQGNSIFATLVLSVPWGGWLWVEIGSPKDPQKTRRDE